MVAPLVAAAGIGAVGSVLGGVVGGKGAKKQAKVAQQTQDNTIAAAERNRDYQYNLNAPTIQHGGNAENTIAALLGLGGDAAASRAAFDQFRGSTGYDFRLNEGLSATNNQMFAGGAGQSGAALKALADRGQNMASAEFGNYMGYLGGLQAAGANARSLVAGVGNNATNTLANAFQVGGQQQANAAQANTNNWTNVLQNLANAGAYAYGSSYQPNGLRPGDVPAMIARYPGVF